jgi:hypothetical protein
MTLYFGKVFVHAFNYRKERKGRWPLVDVGFWAHEVPRPVVRCFLFGHRPVVDGTPRCHWVVCDRCGTRPTPQGNLDADLVIGQPYEGFQLTTDAVLLDAGPHAPGPFPTPRGVIGGQLVLLGGMSGPSIEVKIGNAGSEHTLAAHVSLGRLGALYLHTESFGQGIQRRLNPVGYESRVTGVSMHDRRLWWNLWAKRNESSKSDPWWMHGSIKIDPRDIIWGEKRYWHDKVGEPVASVLSMPEQDYPTNLQLERCEVGRPRGRRKFDYWAVDLRVQGGIPTERRNHGHYYGFGVKVSDTSVTDGTWEMEALSAAHQRITQERIRQGFYKPTLRAASE